MAETDYRIVFGIMAFITAVWGLVAKMLWSKFNNVQYKDNCAVQVKSFEQKIDSQKELLENKFDNLNKDIVEIKDLIKKNGNSQPRVQT